MILLDTSLLNTQHYKVRIRGKVVQSREMNSTFPQHHRVVTIVNVAFELLSSTVANFILHKYSSRELSTLVSGKVYNVNKQTLLLNAL